MIVIVIVGILSAVALPNFLSQTNKAKGTEGRSQISSIIKGAAASYLEGGDTKMDAAIAAADTEATPNAESTCNLWGGPDDEVTLFNYQCSFTSPTLTVTATGNDSDSSLTGAAIVHNVDLTTGIVEPDDANTSKMFGGLLDDPTGEEESST